MLSGNFAEMTSSTPFRDLFTCRKSTTWDQRLYFPSEGRRAEDFFALNNPKASAGFEPANLGTKGQHAAPRPPYYTKKRCYFLSLSVQKRRFIKYIKMTSRSMVPRSVKIDCDAFMFQTLRELVPISM